jgi:Na+/H+-dicarboxylate symporter
MSRKIKEYRHTFSLDGASIDEFSEVLEASLIEIDMERQNRVRIRLAVEECLLKLRDAFGEEHPVDCQITHRYGRPHIQMELEGIAFNPISAEMGDWSEGLLSSVGFVPQYNYLRGRNVIRLTLPAQRMNLAKKTVIMIGVGAVLGWLLDLWLSDPIKEELTDAVFQPIIQIWNDVLVTVAGPVIFLMILSSMMDTGLLDRMGGSIKRVLGRYMIYTLLIAALAEIISLAVFQPGFRMDRFGKGLINAAMDFFANLIPDSVMEPIITANTPQILLVTFVIGTVILAIRGRVGMVVELIKQLGVIGTEVTVLISRLVPYVAMIFVISKMISTTPGILLGVWRPFVVAMMLGALVLLIALLNLCFTRKVSLRNMYHKLKPPFLTVVRTGRLDAARGQTEQCCITQLGIQREFLNASLPYGLVLFVPVGIAGVLIFTIYVAADQGIVLTPLWLLAAIIITITIYEVTPPLPGVDLITYIAIFQQMGIQESAVIAAMIYDILFWLFAYAENQALLQIELVVQAEQYGMLNLDVLRRPVRIDKKKERV